MINFFTIKSKHIVIVFSPICRCAVIRHIARVDAIGLAINYLYTNYFADTNTELRDFPLFFARVSFLPSVPEHEMITDIYLPIE
ncbi:GyrI-like domain-containing protein [Colwelliaceae bacterium 6471]